MSIHTRSMRTGETTTILAAKRFVDHHDRRRHPRPQRVLVVDDSEDLRELWRLWLTFWNFSVDEARNGQEAVRKAVDDAPDLILMDFSMPGVGGAEALKRLKGDPRTAAIPVVVPKPAAPDMLLDQIRVAMRRYPPA